MAAFELVERTPDLTAILQAGLLDTSVSQMARELGVSRTTVRAIAREERGVSPTMQEAIRLWYGTQRETRDKEGRKELYNGIDTLNRLSRDQRRELVILKDKTNWQNEKDRSVRSYSRSWRQYRKKGGKFSVFSP